MTKYSTPSIEVVNFSSSDAPRIGMQWFYMNSNTTYVPAPSLYTGPQRVTYQDDQDLTQLGVNCSSVTVYRCNPEELPSDALVGHEYQKWVTDDGASC